MRKILQVFLQKVQTAFILLCILSKGISRGVQSTEDAINIYPKVMIQDDRSHSVEFLNQDIAKIVLSNKVFFHATSSIHIQCEQELFRALEM